MLGTYDTIQEFTLDNGSVQSLDIQNVPQTYTDLRLIVHTPINSTGSNFYININNQDTYSWFSWYIGPTDYPKQSFEGSGTAGFVAHRYAPGNSRWVFTGQYAIGNNSTAIPTIGVFDFLSYSNPKTQKVVHYDIHAPYTASSTTMYQLSGLATSIRREPIQNLTIRVDSTYISANSSFRLIGIKAT